MVCSCENRCSCEEHCTCCGKCCTCLLCHETKICNRAIFPVCKAPPVGTKDEIRFGQRFQPEMKITETCSPLPVAKDIVETHRGTQNYESSKHSTVSTATTSNNSSLNDSDLLISENSSFGQTKLSAEKTSSVSRFGSLKLTMQKMKSRFKKTKRRKNDHCSLLTAERGHEAFGESSVETASSKETDSFPSKVAKSLKNKIISFSTDNSLHLSRTYENVSFNSSEVVHNNEETTYTRSLKPTLNAETGAFFEKQYGESNGAFIDDNRISRNKPTLHPEGSLHSPQSCSTPLSLNLNWSNVQNIKREKPPISNNEKQDSKLPKDIKCKTFNFKNSENFCGGQWNVTFKPSFFTKNSTKSSTSNNDKSLTVPLFSNFRDELPSTQLYSSNSCARAARSSLDKRTNSEFSDNKNHSGANSEIISEHLNKSSKACPLSSTASSKSSAFLEENGTPHSHLQEPLLSSQSHISLDSKSFLKFSLEERIGLNNSDSQDKDTTDNSTLHSVSTYLSDDFETFYVTSSPDSTDSESVSSSEFLPCTYCRFVTQTPPTSDSIIPYETLE